MNGSETANREVVLERLYDAPRERVFEAWSDPKHLARWWGPLGFTTTTYEMDFRTGGVWRFTMHGPDGTDFENRIEYTEVTPPERLRYRHGGEGEHEDIQFETTVTFEDRDGKTFFTSRMVFPTTEERDRVVREFGAIEGGKQTFERLAEFLRETGG